jgi:hypothetical protein
MVETGIRNGHDVGIGEFLRARARRASDSRIAVDISVGAVAMIVAAALRPELWMLLASAGLCLASFGVWAALERASFSGSQAGRYDRPIAAARAVFAWLAIAAALATGFFFWTVLMGTWIS